MKDQYFGDINDYFKYGLLRCFSQAGLSIGVCWMMTPNDGRADGRKIDYLANRARWRDYDPNLFDSLAEAVKRRRGIRQIEDFEILPTCSFYSAFVPNSQRLRNKWLSKALRKLSGVDLLFFDPDNGIEVRSTPSGKRGSNKFLYWHEIERAWAQGGSLLIFQHFPRQKREEYVLRVVSELSEHVPGGKVVPLITSNVVYLVAYPQRHNEKIYFTVDLITKTWMGQVGGCESILRALKRS